ncbi:hypothetical protein PQ469_30280 [Mucilaginibacter sp. KACC 22773]|jgi:hypothetical protein|uniref:hypothetical protein n=1 Tax=Mucilaginibacter sp. KACC 22773 TaxID=3025671 RepID=UPI0023664645|nr:hypothetical protein [Mucilaginibacter sp. KACC 22773]WDF78175.1 hypothetical protein PQ469_30280 [Mucilaginibacter sp. KACC 22773]
MVKWFAYIVLLLIFTPHLSDAGTTNSPSNPVEYHHTVTLQHHNLPADTTLSKSKKEQEEKNKIKEVAKAKRQAKPAKVNENTLPVAPKPKPKRQRRPEGLERPPEIPRRNGD